LAGEIITCFVVRLQVLPGGDVQGVLSLYLGLASGWCFLRCFCFLKTLVGVAVAHLLQVIKNKRLHIDRRHFSDNVVLPDDLLLMVCLHIKQEGILFELDSVALARQTYRQVKGDSFRQSNFGIWPLINPIQCKKGILSITVDAH
jgi:hypothetical protein